MKLKSKPPLLSRQTGLDLSRRPIRRRCECRIAASASPSFCQQEALTGFDEIPNQDPGVALPHHRADWDFENEVGSRRAMLVTPFAVLAPLPGVVALIVIVDKCGKARRGFYPDASAISSMSPVRAPTGDILLSARAQNPVPPVSGLDENVDLVEKHRRLWRDEQSGQRGGDTDIAMVSSPLEADVAVHLCKEGVITTHSHIGSRAKPGSPLAHQDAPRAHLLPSEALHSKHFGLAVSPVSTASDSLFMGHTYFASIFVIRIAVKG